MPQLKKKRAEDLPFYKEDTQMTKRYERVHDINKSSRKCESKTK